MENVRKHRDVTLVTTDIRGNYSHNKMVFRVFASNRNEDLASASRIINIRN